jgi:cell division protein FtsB
MSAPHPENAKRLEELEELRNALKETVMNLESLVEKAERVLRRARARLEDLTEDDEYGC